MVAFLFAGQGSQYVGMGKDLYESFPEAKAVFDKGEAALGFELKKLCFEGPQEKLKATDISQPAIVTASIAAYESFKAINMIIPDFVAGLSLGEYSALIAAGVFGLEDGLRLVRRRGQIMEDASRKNPGGMAAVLDLPVEKIKEICLKSGAEVANLNSPGQTVITGKKEAVNAAGELCSRAGAKRVIPLEVSGGFHSSLMLEASKELKKALDSVQLKDSSVKVISNFSASSESASAKIKENLVCQMYSPVRWEDSMRFMIAQGVGVFYEFGPGKVLKGLMRKIDPSVQVTSIEKNSDLEGLSIE